MRERAGNVLVLAMLDIVFKNGNDARSLGLLLTSAVCFLQIGVEDEASSDADLWWEERTVQLG